MLTFRTVNLAALCAINPRHSHVMLGLYRFADRHGRCFPELRTLAEICCMSRSAVQRAIAEMIELGYLTVRKRCRSSHVYQIAERLLVKPKVVVDNDRPAAAPRQPESSPTFDESSPASGTEGVTEKETIKDRASFKEKRQGDSSWREAPLAPAAPERTPNVVRLKRQPAGPPKSPALKANIRDQLMQKLSRFLQATGGDVMAFWEAQTGDDKAAAQRVFDLVDRQMRARKWDDVPAPTWRAIQ